MSDVIQESHTWSINLATAQLKTNMAAPVGYI